jgi:hypothetical protein
MGKVAPTAPLVQYDASSLPSLPEKGCTDYHRTTANLQQFERWVSQNIDSWPPTGDVQVMNACPKLYDFMIQYHQLANIHYANSPEGLSVMVLTIFELWVACDKVAVQKCQLLSEYAPEVPLEALQNLLLLRADQMERLKALESYVQGRSSRSRNEFAGLLLSSCDANSFGARYFATMPDHKPYRYESALVLPKEFSEILVHLPLHHDKLAACQTPGDRYSATIWLATLAFADGADMEMLQILAMFCKCPDLLKAWPPSISRFDLAEGKACSVKLLAGIVKRYVLPLEVCPEFTFVRKGNELLKSYNFRRETAWEVAHKAEVEKVVEALAYQWPCPSPKAPPMLEVSKHINGASLMRAVQAKFQIWYNNRLLQDYLDSTVFSLFSLTTHNVRPSPLEYEPAPQYLSPVGHFSMKDVFAASALKDVKMRPRPSLPNLVVSRVKQSKEAAQPRLRNLLQTLDQTIGRSNYERSYLSDLDSSLDALLGQDQQHSVSKGLTSKLFAEYLSQCEEYAITMHEQILESINSHPDSSGERTLQHWPRMSPSLLLQHLAHDQRDEFPGTWKTHIVRYGVALTDLQRAGRLLQLHAALEKGGRKTQVVTSDKGSQAIDLLNELRNPGYLNWEPHKYPKYLLMEVESGILIRDVQQQIACEMRKPSIDDNAIMQLNMREGKSTVITPMVAAALADGSQLVRVVVAKPQSKQMAQMLISKFGGLLRRRIYYMPFSRSLPLRLCWMC